LCWARLEGHTSEDGERTVKRLFLVCPGVTDGALKMWRAVYRSAPSDPGRSLVIEQQVFRLPAPYHPGLFEAPRKRWRVVAIADDGSRSVLGVRTNRLDADLLLIEAADLADPRD
jgi:hypothetical protein